MAIRNLLAVVLLRCAVGGPPLAHAGAKVVVSAGTRWVGLLPHPEWWEFVRANADGFHVNFIGMDHAPQVKFNDLAKLMSHMVAYLKSNPDNATLAADDRSLLML